MRSVSPAAGSHFPQLARPLPGGAAVTGDTHDTMSPTAAPWAVDAPAPPPSQAASASVAAGGGALDGAQAQLSMPGVRGLSPGVAALRRPPGGPAALLTGRPVAPLVEATPKMPKPLAAGAGADAAAAAAAEGPSAATAAATRCFEAPTKRIASEDDLRRFLEGETARDFVAFILSLNQAVTGTKLSAAPAALSPAVEALAGALDELRAWVDEVPPAAQSLRYGNPAYRTWSARVAAAAPEMVARMLRPAGLEPAAAELAPYFADSFGNATRIDYGTGHETAFAALLYCLAALGAVGEADRVALVNVAFEKYLRLMRHVQTTYWLEPAGSHGVWGLDDYQFLPFVFGSAQLVGHPFIRPKSIHSEDVLEAYSEDYTYLGCVQFVKRVKKGPLFETSPMLDDVSGVPNWGKVNAGMLKMYQAEVLGKFPIMQHFLFGSLIRWQG